jgi:hypothetical protein
MLFVSHLVEYGIENIEEIKNRGVMTDATVLMDLESLVLEGLAKAGCKDKEVMKELTFAYARNLATKSLQGLDGLMRLVSVSYINGKRVVSSDRKLATAFKDQVAIDYLDSISGRTL